MAKRLLIIGGVLNTIFFLFHIQLGYQIHHLTQVSSSHRALMEALNGAGVLFIFFFAYVSFFHAEELIETGLGRIVLALVAVLYLSRAAEEFFLFAFTPLVFGSCLLVGALYVALFTLALQQVQKPATYREAEPRTKPPEQRRAA